MVWEVKSRSDLTEEGWTSRAITRAVRSGVVIRARQDRYVLGDPPCDLIKAIRIGGRLGCLSLLALLGVFVFEVRALHVHMERGDSRMRSATAPRKRLPPRGRRPGIVLHWRRLAVPAELGCVGIVDALIHSFLCQQPKHALATLDSALNKGLIAGEQVKEVFASLPARFGVMMSFVDGRAQSGPESLVRLMVIHLGCTVDSQVEFDGVGRVDLVVDGWLVVECDSKAFHSSWDQQLTDYRRDLALAGMGYCVLRLTAADIMYDSDTVFESLRGILRSRRVG